MLTSGDVDNGIINVVVEIPTGGTDKIEWNHHTCEMEIDRRITMAFPEPTNYGFVPRTVAEDGDELDVVVLSDDALPTGTTLSARIIGIMKFIDDGDNDDKIIVVPIGSEDEYAQVNSVKDLSKEMTDNTAYFFTHYKDHIKPGRTEVMGWLDTSDVKIVINQAIERYNETNK